MQKIQKDSEKVQLKKELEHQHSSAHEAAKLSNMLAAETTVVPAEFTTLDELQTDLFKSPPNSPVKTSHLSAKAGKRFSGDSRSQRAASLRSRHTSSPLQETLLKPAIAPTAGTTKAASMCQRPKPSLKPRSEKASVRKGTFVFKQYTIAKQIPDPILPEVLSSDLSMEAESNKNSDRPDGRTRQEVRMVKKTSDSISPIVQQGVSMFKADPVNWRDRIHPTQACHLKSTAQMLEEAAEIAGIRLSGLKEEPHLKQEGIKQRGVSVKTLDRESGRKLDKITANQEEFNHSAVSDSDKRTEECQGTVPQDSCTRGHEPCSTENTSNHQMPQHTYDMKGLQTPQPTDGIKNMAERTTVEESNICSEDYVIAASALPLEVTYSDLLTIKGAAIATDQRQRTVFKHQCSLHGLSHLAAWTPRTNDEQSNTIHHLCTESVSDVLPFKLQLASRACHAPSKMSVKTDFVQQRAVLGQISDRVQHRTVEHGVSPLKGTSEEDNVTHVDSSMTGSLLEWQRLAEHYVESPRMVLHGKPMPLCSNCLKMFWNPAPPKFSCAPSVIRQMLFPKYQATRRDPANENQCEDLLSLETSVCGIKEKEEKWVFKNSQSMVDMRKETTPSAGCEVHGLKRCQSAPLLTPGPEAWAVVTAPQKLESVPLQPDVHVVTDPTKGTNPEAREQHLPRTRVRGRRPLGKRARRAGMAHSKRQGRKRMRLKVAYAREKLREPPGTLSRSHSLDILTRRRTHSSPSGHSSLWPCLSLPQLLDFKRFTSQRGGIIDGVAPLQWVQDIWCTWFDERFPPEECADREADSNLSDLHCCPGKAPQGMQDREPTLGMGVTGPHLEHEVARLTQSMAEQNRASAFDLCRRGALRKVLGHLTLALEDLNKAISLEPKLLDAYWHRHSVYLLRSKPLQAMEDLNFIIKHKNMHADAFRSKAEIYRQRGDTMMAIANYTQAIKCKPDDEENYFRRAEMYKERNEIILAMEDYAKTFAINPRRTDALLIHGLHCFHSSSWAEALKDFSLLLQQEPNNSKARQYRGRTYIKLGKFQEALEDLSLAVHLDPNDWKAFYYRGCLLRKSQPTAALRDLSTSVLINESVENFRAFLHRGQLYIECKGWKEAVSDFATVIKLDRSVMLAYINLGLIYMLKMDRNQEAIQMFSEGLKINPTYVRGYMCRAQAYHNVKDFRHAVKDLTRAIHTAPDALELYIMRGQYLCDMEQFDLAAFCIQYAAKMNSDLGSSPVQQAAVQSFLGNNSEAMDYLLAAAGNQPSAHVFVLLGKSQMKARMFTEAIDSFRMVLTSLSPNEAGMCSVAETAEVFYLTGLCYVAQADLSQALHAFSCAIKVNPGYANAYHQRGLCLMRLKQAKCMLDFNRALAINPNLHQVYLSRAAFYRGEGRYSKAMLNCTEAIKVQPNSARARLYRGTLRFHLRMYMKAVEDFTIAMRLDENDSLAFYNRGLCYQQLKQNELALRDYSVVLLLPNEMEIDFKVLINRGLLYVELNDNESALQDFKAASRKCPEDATIFHAVGVLHHRLGQLQASVEAYSQAMRLDPFFLEAYVGRGNVLMDFCQDEASKKAQRDFVTALHLSPLCSAARISLGYNFQVFGFLRRALDQFTVAADIDPGSWAAFEGRAVVNLQTRNTYAALQDINTALKNPLSDQLHTNRGVINQFMGNVVMAMRDYQKAISLNPQYALAHFNAANLYFYNRQFGQACEFYSRAIELDPSDESALLNRAITRALLMKVPEALEDFSMALKLNPFNGHVFFNRANVYCSLRKYSSAEEDLTQALKLQPNDALLYKLRADVRGHLGWNELAISDYRLAMELQETEEQTPPGMCFTPAPHHQEFKYKSKLA